MQIFSLLGKRKTGSKSGNGWRPRFRPSFLAGAIPNRRLFGKHENEENAERKDGPFYFYRFAHVTSPEMSLHIKTRRNFKIFAFYTASKIEGEARMLQKKSSRNEIGAEHLVLMSLLKPFREFQDRDSFQSL